MNPPPLRRQVLRIGATALAVWGGATHIRAQSRPARRIGYLVANDRATNAIGRSAFETSLTALGWTIGRDLLIEYRYGEGDATRIAEAARALVAERPDVLVAGSNAGVAPLRDLTDVMPIVGTSLADPVGAGLVRSLARTGTNVTGVSASNGPGVLGKRLQMLTAFVPRARRIGVLRVPGEYTEALWLELDDASKRLGVTLMTFDAEASQITMKLPVVAAARLDALFLMGQGSLIQRMQPISEFAIRERLPACHSLKPFARAGLLFTFGIDLAQGFRLAAGQVDRILRGEQAGNLPIVQINRYELVINRHTSGVLGLRIPPELLAIADEVIE